MIRRLSYLPALWGHFGPVWLGRRLAYAARTRAGGMARRLPAQPWEALPLSAAVSQPILANADTYHQYRRQHAPPFFFRPGDLPLYQPHFARWDMADRSPLPQVAALREGIWHYFAGLEVKAGLPPDWHANPLTGQRAPKKQHWSRFGDYEYGDIKMIWEASRFGVAYLLVRAYWRTGDNEYAELFWQLVENWRLHNPPELGPNWKCGQETSFRVMAWCFALYGFMEAPASTPGRVAGLAQMLATFGYRIAGNLGYALAQQNNHGISEGLGLWTLATLFPEFKEAKRWDQKGRSVLEAQARALIYDDGSFSQHSFNYQRLMLHDYVWVVRLGEILGQPFSTELRQRLDTSAELLFQVQDEYTGQAPDYGQNDGALILPLDNCAFGDYRPITQSVKYACTGRRLYESGPWDEDLLWLFGPQALESPHAPVSRHDLNADDGGYYTLRSTTGFVFTRCPQFRHRPGHADLLHVDLWWQGQNIVVDPGTFSYNAPAPWDNALARTAYHSTVSVDGTDQMERIGRFLWLPWARGRVRTRWQQPGGVWAYWEGEHDGYARLPSPVWHRRGILRGPGVWIVLDALTSAGNHDYRLHWLFSDLPYVWDEQGRCMELTTPAGPYRAHFTASKPINALSLVRADRASPRGWIAPGYQDRAPALSLALTVRAPQTLFVTAFGPAITGLGLDDHLLFVHTVSGEIEVAVQSMNAYAIVQDARVLARDEARVETDIVKREPGAGGQG